MSNTSRVFLRGSSRVRTHEFTRDTVLDVLSNRRRRFAIHYLKSRDGEVRLRDLAERIACWENEKTVDELSYRERKRVQSALRQFHLPKMVEWGLVEYDDEAGTVALTETASNSNFYVDVVSERGIPWGLYYLGFSSASAVCLLLVWTGVYPFAALSPFEWGLFFVTLLGASSLAHYYDNRYRMRLGAREDPPGVNER